jgi:hypothetical protein
MEARTLAAAAYFDPAADTVANVTTVATVTNAVTAGTVSDKTGYALSIAGVSAVQSGLATGADLTTVGNNVSAVLTDTGTTIPALIAALNNLSAAQVNAEVVDVLRTDLIPDSYAADGAQPTFAQAVLTILQVLTEKSVSGTTVTVNKPDGTTAALTLTLNDGTTPAAITRAT